MNRTEAIIRQNYILEGANREFQVTGGVQFLYLKSGEPSEQE